MKVIKSNGSEEELDVRKIKKQTRFACLGIPNISPEEIEADAQINFYDGINTSDIQKSIIDAAKSKIDVDRPDVSYVAARLHLYSMYHSYSKTRDDMSFRTYVEDGVTDGILNPELLSFELDRYCELIRFSNDKIMNKDYIFSYAAIVNFDVKILNRNDNGDLRELPQFSMLANSMMLSIFEEHDDLKFDFVSDHYKLISSHIAMTSTPTLSNARRPRPQLSSCYIGATGDNIEGITESYSEIALLSKFGGGIGWDWNDVRSNNSVIDGHGGVSGGIVPMLKVLNDVGLAFDQLGCVSNDAEVLVVDSVTVKGIEVDFSNGIGLLKYKDEYDNIANFSSNQIYDTIIEDKNLAASAVSCLFV